MVPVLLCPSFARGRPDVLFLLSLNDNPTNNLASFTTYPPSLYLQLNTCLWLQSKADVLFIRKILDSAGGTSVSAAEIFHPATCLRLARVTYCKMHKCYDGKIFAYVI